MFEEELELEKKEGSSFGPLIVIVLLGVLIFGGAGYLIYQSRQTLKTDEAAQVVSKMLSERPPSTVSFHTGTVSSSMFDSTEDPHYRLLAKAGILKMEKIKKSANLKVSLTPDGDTLLTSLQSKKTEKGEETEYKVPLATRKLVNVTQITKVAPNRFVVSYTWQWVPNKLGDDFDAAGNLVKGFNTWDRQQLIDKHGAAFYHQAPEQSAVTVMKGTNGWELATE
ncbi:MAG TPA: hypothetical protein VMT82_10250 [candidate division Zixibacteria bacterium]|nr:hypothetical protein [candidate division Zixibacteria bacterium]